MPDRLLAAIQESLPNLDCRADEPLSRHTSFRVGGPAKRMLFPSTALELEKLCALLRRLGEKPLLLGNGSNVLAPDQGLDGTVVVTAKAAAVSRTGNSLEADCGAGLTMLASFAADGGLSGLEFAYGIPGTLGGALIMNAGAYGGQMADVTEWTEFLDEDLCPRRFEGAEHGFAYRHSGFPAGAVILRAGLRLTEDEPAAVRARCAALLDKRKSAQPLDKPSAGSAFKRPAGGYAAALIDQAGLKGYRVGGAQVSEKHAGFVINCGNATAWEIRKLLEDVRQQVYQRSGVLLEPEIRIL